MKKPPLIGTQASGKPLVNLAPIPLGFGHDDQDLTLKQLSVASGILEENADLVLSTEEEKASDDDGIDLTSIPPVEYPPAHRYEARGKSGENSARSIGKYDHVYILHIETREQLSTIKRRLGNYSEGEIASAQEMKDRRITWLIANGHINYRADHIERVIERSLMRTLNSIEHDAGIVADTLRDVDTRTKHARLLKDSLAMLQPVIDRVKAREDKPEGNAKPIIEL